MYDTYFLCHSKLPTKVSCLSILKKNGAFSAVRHLLTPGVFGPQTRPPGPMDVLDLHRLDLLQCGALQPGTLEVLPVGKKKQQKIAVGLGMGWNWTIFGLRDISWREKFEGFFLKGSHFF